jgi:hypothetical protein
VTPADLANWEAIASAASAAPWVADIDDGVQWTGKFYIGTSGRSVCWYNYDAQVAADIRLVEASRIALPALCAEVRRLRAIEAAAIEWSETRASEEYVKGKVAVSCALGGLLYALEGRKPADDLTEEE